MFKSPVVFVLGAGASKSYQYPTGPELLNEISDLGTERIPGHAVLEAVKSLPLGLEELGRFQEVMRKASPTSIDAFLERRQDKKEIGKFLIAAHIMNHEHDSSFDNSDDHWYQLLLDKLDDPFDSVDFTNVTIVTFNYDRSLEQFLFRSLCSRHNKNSDEVSAALSKLKIIHAYGHVGPLDWQVPGARPYGLADLTADAVKKAAAGIKIISEAKAGGTHMDEARAALKKSNRVIFLGMAYHPDNMQLLGVPFSDRGEDGARQLSGSMYSMSHHQVQHHREQFGFTHSGADNEKCKKFLLNNPDFLRL